MYALKIIMIIGAVIFALAFLICAMRSRKPFRTIVFSALIGLAALLVVNISGIFTGVSIALNPWTVLCSAAAGVPGVLLLLAMRMVWSL